MYDERETSHDHGNAVACMVREAPLETWIMKQAVVLTDVHQLETYAGMLQ
jgi:hypothetical protein